MEIASQVDVDHGLKVIGRNPQRWRGKIACCGGNQHIESTSGLMHLPQGAFDRRVITDIPGIAHGLNAIPTYKVDSGFYLVVIYKILK
jgi:hypothetical protein